MALHRLAFVLFLFALNANAELVQIDAVGAFDSDVTDLLDGDLSYSISVVYDTVQNPSFTSVSDGCCSQPENLTRTKDYLFDSFSLTVAGQTISLDNDFLASANGINITDSTSPTSDGVSFIGRIETNLTLNGVNQLVTINVRLGSFGLGTAFSMIGLAEISSVYTTVLFNQDLTVDIDDVQLQDSDENTQNGTLITFSTLPPPTPTVRMQLDATGTSFFNDFSIVFEDTGDGLLQHDEIVLFSGVTGTSPATGEELVYSDIAYVPPIPGISTASGTVNPTSPCPQCWELTPSNFGGVSDGLPSNTWTYAVSALSALSQSMNFSYTFDGTDGNAWSPGATLSGQIQGIVQADGDTIIIESFGTVSLTRPGLPDFEYASIENDEFNAWPNVDDVPVMSFSGLKNNFRSCPEGFLSEGLDDCAFSDSPGGGFLMSFDPSILMGSWITAADGTGNTPMCNGGGAQRGCRVQDRPIDVDNWSLTVEVPADDCTSTAGGCNPTGGHEFVLPDGFVVPDGGIITQTATPFVDPRVDENGRCDGTVELRLFNDKLIIPAHICGSPEFEVLETEASFDILEGTILNTMFPEVFVTNPLDCMRPVIGDPQLQDIVVWQPAMSAEVIEGHALELTFDCGSSRGKTRGFSFYIVGMHIDFGLDFDLHPEDVTQAFIDLTSAKYDSLATALNNALPALSRRDFRRLFKISSISRKLYDRGRFQAASRTLETFIRLTERAQFDTTSADINHEGNLLSRAENIKFTLIEKIIPFAKVPVRRR